MSIKANNVITQNRAVEKADISALKKVLDSSELFPLDLEVQDHRTPCDLLSQHYRF